MSSAVTVPIATISMASCLKWLIGEGDTATVSGFHRFRSTTTICSPSGRRPMEAVRRAQAVEFARRLRFPLEPLYEGALRRSDPMKTTHVYRSAAVDWQPHPTL